MRCGRGGGDGGGDGGEGGGMRGTRAPRRGGLRQEGGGAVCARVTFGGRSLGEGAFEMGNGMGRV